MDMIDRTRLRRELESLYGTASKHSAYQDIPDFIEEALGYQVEINQEWRGDRPRLTYISSLEACRDGRRWCDVGANTGFFTLTLAHGHPGREFLAVESNPTHARFIRIAAAAFGLENVSLLSDPLTLDSLEQFPVQDVMLHLNVLHHAGADFDRAAVGDVDSFLRYATTYLRRLRGRTSVLVFQMGSNLWGDKSKPIVPASADADKLKLFSSILVDAGWIISDVAYATKRAPSEVSYGPLDADFVKALSRAPDAIPTAHVDRLLAGFSLQSHLGEFYRRPLFTCRAR